MVCDTVFQLFVAVQLFCQNNTVMKNTGSIFVSCNISEPLSTPASSCCCGRRTFIYFIIHLRHNPDSDFESKC